MRTIRIPHTNGYAKRSHGKPHCVVCGKTVRQGDALPHVECIGGACDIAAIGDDIDTSAPDYMGCHPVGHACLKRHPELKPFVTTIRVV